jgi:hypothetical protein
MCLRHCRGFKSRNLFQPARLGLPKTAARRPKQIRRETTPFWTLGSILRTLTISWGCPKHFKHIAELRPKHFKLRATPCPQIAQDAWHADFRTFNSPKRLRDAQPATSSSWDTHSNLSVAQCVQPTERLKRATQPFTNCLDSTNLRTRFRYCFLWLENNKSGAHLIIDSPCWSLATH